MKYRDFIYDIETYPNIFTCAIREAGTDNRWMFEISSRCNDAAALVDFLNYLIGLGNARMVGFNSYGFDYPIIHLFYKNPYVANVHVFLYEKCQQIIEDGKTNHGRFKHIIWDRDHIITQLDLFKVFHFDNRAKSVSLKALEFNMQMDNIKDLPFAPGTILTSEQMDDLRYYNFHDVDATHLFYTKSQTEIAFREELSEQNGGDPRWLNFSDKKIGTEIYINRLEAAAPGSCYHRVDGKRKKRQTIREYVNINDVLFDYISFEQPEFNRVLNYFRNTTLTHTKKDALGNLSCVVGGLKFVFGVGGLHGSIESNIVESDENNMIIDLDVTSYYPSLGMVNDKYPEHLSNMFCKVASDIKTERTHFPKGTTQNLAYKLSMNGAYGDTNSEHSPFLDMQYMVTITVNGQLLLCMLSEAMLKIPGLEMVQANTDGITFKCPRNQYENVQTMRKWWQDLTGLELEEALYSRMFIRDVNNYVAEYTDGKVKRKGTYEHDLEWHKDFSARIVAMAAEENLLNGTPIREFIENHEDAHDFMIKAKVNKTDHLYLSEPVPLYYYPEAKEYSLDPNLACIGPCEDTAGGLKKHPKEAAKQNVFPYQDTEIERISRYYVANEGRYLFKVMPPLKKNPTKVRRNAITKGYKVRICNDILEASPWDVNYDYYVAKAEKLVKPLRKAQK